MEAILDEWRRISQVREAYDHPNKNIHVGPLMDKIETLDDLDYVFNILTQRKYANVFRQIKTEARSAGAAFETLHIWCEFVLEMVVLQELPFVQPDFDDDGSVIMRWTLVYPEEEGYIEMHFWPSRMIRYALNAPVDELRRETHEGTLSITKMIQIIKLYRNKIKEEKDE